LLVAFERGEDAAIDGEDDEKNWHKDRAAELAQDASQQSAIVH
jgi:hypothetical protein